MSNAETTGQIRIIKTPAGQAPEEIRKAWVGLVLPCGPIAGYLESGTELGALSLEPINRGRRTVSVPQVEALEILAKERPFAAEWWAEMGFPRAFASRFAFGLDEVEILDGVEHQRIIEVTNEMQGDPNR